MPYKIIVLRPGVCREIPNSSNYHVKCTITLILGTKHKLIVDTGSAWEKEFLLKELEKHEILPDDNDYVIGTHGHSDHIGNLNLFTNATHIVCHDVNKGNTYIPHDFNAGVPYAIDEDITIESLPGHTSQDITVFVKSDSEHEGLVAICGDIFECCDDLEDPLIWQTQSQHLELQSASRAEILSRADCIIPGHGTMFRVQNGDKTACEIHSEED